MGEGMHTVSMFQPFLDPVTCRISSVSTSLSWVRKEVYRGWGLIFLFFHVKRYSGLKLGVFPSPDCLDDGKYFPFRIGLVKKTRMLAAF